MTDDSFSPRQYPGVMVSSTFTDLERHRAALIKAIESQSMLAVSMEQDAALPSGTVIDSSLRKVRDAAAYIGLVSHRYGNVPVSVDSNPDGLSLTELEFREARRLGRPMLIFIMGADHEVRFSDVELDPDMVRKLGAFRDQVKHSTSEPNVHRVYKEFNSLREFELAAMQSVAELRRHLEARSRPAPAASPPASAGSGSARSHPAEEDGIPRPPALYAEPRYIGSHAFTGRVAELETLSDWAAPAEAHPVLFYEAIGGTGKSMLTWEWTVNHAGARTDWAGRFWYSFYEKGADMTDFCRRALTYMTGQRLAALRKMRQAELSERLLRQLQARPWLLVLDGLERVLVAYNRYDAAQVADEEAGRTDQIARRDPSSAIRPRDDDLLRALAGAAPSKILITSRLMPRVLLNRSGQPIPGVLHQRLPGLRPADAEALLRACGVRGDSQLIRTYLQQHCDCHPLVTGIVAGLVNDYYPARGSFDAWAADPAHGGHLNLAELDLVQTRNHILKTAVDALPQESRQLLSTLALLSEAVDYDTITALNPYLPPEAKPPAEPVAPEEMDLPSLPPELRHAAHRAREQYAADRERHARAEAAHRSWLESGGPRETARQLESAVRDMERRGLLQYDRQTDRYDLHPVVRGFASGGLQAEERDRLGQRAVDYFSQRPQDLYTTAETLDDVRNGLRLVRALLQMDRKQEALAVYQGGLSTSLIMNLEAYFEILSLVRPFFGKEWAAPTSGLSFTDISYLLNEAAFCLTRIGQLEQSFTVLEIRYEIILRTGDWFLLFANMRWSMAVFERQHRFARCDKLTRFMLEHAELSGYGDYLFCASLYRFRILAAAGRWDEANAMWLALDPMGRDWQRIHYRPGDAEAAYAEFLFRQGRLDEAALARAETLARSGRNRHGIRFLHALRGRWQLELGELALAEEDLHEATRLAREAGASDPSTEARLALVRFRLGQFPEARQEAVRLSSEPGARVSSESGPADLALAELLHALGDREQATEHALAAYRWAWADGPPYVDRYELSRAAALLDQLGVPVPELPPYDPAGDSLPFEDEIAAAMSRHRTEQAARRRQVQEERAATLRERRSEESSKTATID
jgi:tetratricopeptide (TPR) repeat protein